MACNRFRSQSSSPFLPTQTNILSAPLSFQHSGITRVDIYFPHPLETNETPFQGKTLVPTPVVATTDIHNEFGRVLPKRDNPFTGSTSDVSQVTLRCNVDVQFLPRAPVLLAEEAIGGGAVQPAAPEPAHCESTHDVGRPRSLGAAGLYGGMHRRSPLHGRAWSAVQDMYRAALACDYYVTKYASKMNQTLKPIMDQLAAGIERLAAERAREDESAAEAARALAPLPVGAQGAEPPRKRRRGAYYARARRTVMRLATAANRSVWMSFSEIYIILTTGNDCLQTHMQHTLFCKRLLFMMEECRRALAGKTVRGDSGNQSVHALAFARGSVPSVAADGADQPVGALTGAGAAPPTAEQTDERKPLRVTTLGDSTSDDWRHRGRHLVDFNLFVYHMFVMRVPRTRASQEKYVFEFDAHYGMAMAYVQVLRRKLAVPRIHGAFCPTRDQDAEGNAKYKALLFGHATCLGPGQCQDVACFQSYLWPASGAPGEVAFAWTPAWRARRASIELAARRAEAKQVLARREIVLQDTTLCKEWWADSDVELQRGAPVQWYRHLLRMVLEVAFSNASAPEALLERPLQLLLAFSCVQHLWRHCPRGADQPADAEPSPCDPVAAGRHPDQLTLCEFNALLTRDIAENVDLLAEARGKPPAARRSAAQALAAESDAEGVDRDPVDPSLTAITVGTDEGILEDDVDFEDEVNEMARYPWTNATDIVDFVLHKEDAMGERPSSRDTDAKRHLRELACLLGDQYTGTAAFANWPAATAAATARPQGMTYGRALVGDALRQQAQWIIALPPHRIDSAK